MDMHHLVCTLTELGTGLHRHASPHSYTCTELGMELQGHMAPNINTQTETSTEQHD